jgi:hypothetical protein
MATPLNRAVLERPFPQDSIRSRKGAFGRQLHYVEGLYYIRRLNEAFNGDWSWQVLEHEVHGSEVVVLGVLEAGGVRKFAFGGSSVTTNTATGEVLSLADDLKAAATDALKKACSLLGVGLELYEESTPESSRAISRTNTAPARTPPSPPRVEQPRTVRRDDRRPQPEGAEPERQRLTVRQLRALYAIGHGKGMTDRAIKSLSIERFGAAPEFLTRDQASLLIDELGEK